MQADSIHIPDIVSTGAIVSTDISEDKGPIVLHDSREAPMLSGMTAPESFGKAVRAWREAEGKTQEDLAELLGLSQSRISEIENGRYENVRFKSAIYLTNKTGWPLEDLAAQLDPDYKIRKDQTRHTGGINPPHGTKEVPQHVAAIGLLELKDSSLRGIREEIRQAIGLLSRAERNAKRAIDGKASRTTSHHRSRRGRGGRRGA